MATSARDAGGKARNTATQGEGHNTGAGMPHAVGPKYRDDFVGFVLDTNRHGDLFWGAYNGAGGGFFGNVAPATVAEIGVYTITSGGGVGGVKSLHQNPGVGLNPVKDVPVGTIWTTKAAVDWPDATPIGWNAWAGFIQDHTLIPLGGVAVDFVGVRYDAGSWWSVTRAGALEQIAIIAPGLDLDFVIMGFERTDTGFQFFTLDCSNPRRVVRTNATHHEQFPPTVALTPVIGIGVPEGPQGPDATWGIQVDWYDWGGRTAR